MFCCRLILYICTRVLQDHFTWPTVILHNYSVPVKKTWKDIVLITLKSYGVYGEEKTQQWRHLSVMASQITGNSTVCSYWRQRPSNAESWCHEEPYGKLWNVHDTLEELHVIGRWHTLGCHMWQWQGQGQGQWISFITMQYMKQTTCLSYMNIFDDRYHVICNTSEIMHGKMS